MKELLLDVRIKNNHLYRTIRERFESISAFCLNNKINMQIMYDLINLAISPYRKEEKFFGKLTKTGQKIQAILNLPTEWLFPPELYFPVMEKKKRQNYVNHIEISTQEARSLAMSSLASCQELGVDDGINKEDRKKAVITTLLSSCSKLEQNVIKLRFGLEDEDNPLTLETVGKKLNKSRERIRQIEYRAFRHIRQWPGLKILRDFL